MTTSFHQRNECLELLAIVILVVTTVSWFNFEAIAGVGIVCFWVEPSRLLSRLRKYIQNFEFVQHLPQGNVFISQPDFGRPTKPLVDPARPPVAELLQVHDRRRSRLADEGRPPAAEQGAPRLRLLPPPAAWHGYFRPGPLKSIPLSLCARKESEK